MIFAFLSLLLMSVVLLEPSGLLLLTLVSFSTSDGVLSTAVLFCTANFFSFARATAAATLSLPAGVGSDATPVCAFLALTLAKAAATAETSLLAEAVPEFILALRASDASFCFSSLAFLSRSNLALRASNLILALSALISCCFCSLISALPMR